MNLKPIILCCAASLALTLLAAFGLPSADTASRVASAHERLEVLAFDGEGRPEFQAAVGDLRAAGKDLYIEESIACLLQVLSAGASAPALVVSVTKAKTENGMSSRSRSGTLGDYPLRTR